MVVISQYIAGKIATAHDVIVTAFAAHVLPL
jgi:hypothetical protein